MEAFSKYARYDGEALQLFDKNMKRYIHMGGATKESRFGRPEIDRERLREILAESLPERIIKWNCRLRKIDQEDLSLHFDHGVEKGYDLVVGADGAWSKVRPALTDVRPYYTGVGGYDMYVDDVESRFPDLHRLVNRGSAFAHSDGKSIVAQQKGDGSLIVYANSVRDEHWTKNCGYDVHDVAAAKEALANEFADWDQRLVKFTQVANTKDLTVRCLYMLPVGHRWDHRKGVTLIGDAAHLMTPHAGEGVNTAMEDALNLTDAIVRASKQAGDGDWNNVALLDEEVHKFEEEMFPRAKAVARQSALNTEDMYFKPGAPDSIIASYVRRQLSEHWLVKLLFPLWLVRILLRLFFRW